MSNAYSVQVEKDAPIAYWRLGDSSGPTAYDTAPNRYNGTYYGTETFGQAGPVVGDANTSVLFDGSSGYMLAPATLSTSGWTAITIECWIYLSNVTYATYPRVVSNDYAQGTSRGVDFQVNTTGSGFVFSIGNGTTYSEAVYNLSMTAATWYHYVGTWDGTTIRIYVNGVQQASALLSGAIAAANSLYIGRDSTFSGQFFPGRIGEVAIYNYALSATTILNHYNTALAANGTTIAYVANGQTIQANDIDQAILALQQSSGGQDAGHYYLAGAGYTSGAMDMTYVPSKSRGTTPVSVSIDTSDNSGSGYLAAPATNFLKSYGFQIYANTNGAQSNAQVGGKYTIQY